MTEIKQAVLDFARQEMPKINNQRELILRRDSMVFALRLFQAYADILTTYAEVTENPDDGTEIIFDLLQMKEDIMNIIQKAELMG